MLDFKQRPRPDAVLAPRTSQTLREARPVVSVVALTNDESPSSLRSMVERGPRWERLGVELIIVCSGRRTTRSAVSAIGGGARVFYGPDGATEQELRAIGLAAATGDVVLMVDDPATLDESWIEHVSVIVRSANGHAGA